jgi:hypothetical protein
MSQHIFYTEHQGKPITVMMGYDRPLRHVFMSIMVDTFEDTDEDDEGDAMEVYTSLQDKDAGLKCFDVNYYRRVLERLRITIPESMFTEVMRDQNENVGNRMVTHDLDGLMETNL